MEIKPARGTFQVNPLPNQKRWTDKICDRFFETVADPAPRFFIDTDDFHKKLLDQDILFAINGKHVKAKETPRSIKGVRNCFDQHFLKAFRTVFAGATRFFDGSIDVSIGAQERQTDTPSGRAEFCLLQLNYHIEKMNGDVAISDTYVYVSDSGATVDNSSFERMAESNRHRVVAKDPANQQNIDVLEAIVTMVANDAKMVLVILPNGELNYPTIQALSEVSTPFGLCIRKVSVSFSQEYAELVSIVPTETPVLPFIKKGLSDE